MLCHDANSYRKAILLLSGAVPSSRQYFTAIRSLDAAISKLGSSVQSTEEQAQPATHNPAPCCSLVSKSWGNYLPLFRQLTTVTFTDPPSWQVKLNNLHDHPRATKTTNRVGRGVGGDQGKTAGRGTKGQKARKGGKPGLLFEGGKGHIWRRFPKVRANPSNPVKYMELNLERVAAFIARNRLDPTKVITMKDLRDSGCASKSIRWGIKLLARGCGQINQPIHLQVSACSGAARRAIEQAGGSVSTVYYNDLGLRALLKPENFLKHGRPLPKAVRAWPPRYNGMFDAIGQIPPVSAAPARTPPPAAHHATSAASSTAKVAAL